MDLVNAYRRMFATQRPDELVVWWYCGFVVTRRPGIGEFPLTQAETIMVYRTRDAGPDAFTIDWTEVGTFRDITTGERMTGWLNPFEGALMPHARSFVDGPATFTVTRQGEGIDIALVQHNARVDRVTLETSINDRTIGLKQTETKARTFHRADGSLPPLDGPEATHIDTILSIWSERAAVDDAKQANVASTGFYSSGSRASDGGTGSWASTIVRGTMRKASVTERVNVVAWDRLRDDYPDFFTGDRIDPVWTD